MPVCFLGGGMDSDERGAEEELGGVREEKAIIRIYFTKKKSIFNKKILFLKNDFDIPCTLQFYIIFKENIR